jgi:hypothetical protein
MEDYSFLTNDIYILIDNTNLDTDLVNIYLKRAISAIKGYCNYRSNESLFIETDASGNSSLPQTLADAIIEYCVIMFNNKKTENIIQMTQGSRSQTLNTQLPTEIQSMCSPYRKIRMLG